MAMSTTSVWASKCFKLIKMKVRTITELTNTPRVRTV